jgi:O-methyltransferase involved in polyketide biosynthesis
MQLLHTGTGAVSCKYERNGRKIGETSKMEDKGMNNEVSITALMSSFGRAFHAENEDHPVFADHLAKELMTAEEYAAVLTGTKQYVMLGAGLDTFAFREKEFLSKHRVFEVDHPLTQKDKIERITRAGWTIPDNLTFVPADFTKDNVAERLIDGGVTHL